MVNKSDGRIRSKKEKKILSKFLHRILPNEGKDRENVVNFYKENIDASRQNLLLDNHDHKIKYSTNSLLNIFQKFIEQDEIFEDVLIIPNKVFIIIRFITIEVGDKVNAILQRINASQEIDCLKDNFTFISDRIYRLVLNNSQQSIDLLLDEFNINAQPNGLNYLDNFVTLEEERCLFNYALNLFEENGSNISKLKNRQAVHFGSVFDYKLNTINSETGDETIIDSKLPSISETILKRMIDMDYIPEIPDQCTINYYDYSKGDHIPCHVDTHSMCTDWIVTFSLGSDVVMTFENDRKWKILLKQRSALIMNDEARYGWKHGISKALFDLVPFKSIWNSNNIKSKEHRLALMERGLRISYTFRKRTLLAHRCNLNYSHLCDSQKQTEKELPLNISEVEANELETEFVHQVYSGIAEHFSSTRYGVWPKVASFLDSLLPGSLLLDLGCGNGKYLAVNKQIVTIGSDRCGQLLDICRDKGYEVFINDILTIAHSLRKEIFDACICIAVIHHLATTERRIIALQNIVDLLAIDGKALIYVWAFEQRKGDNVSKYLKMNTMNEKDTNILAIDDGVGKMKLSIHTNRSEFKHQDVFVPWKTKKNNEKEEAIKHRYYHVFRQGELEELINKVEHVQLIESYYDQGNWCAIIQKTLM